MQESVMSKVGIAFIGTMLYVLMFADCACKSVIKEVYLFNECAEDIGKLQDWQPRRLTAREEHWIQRARGKIKESCSPQYVIGIQRAVRDGFAVCQKGRNAGDDIYDLHCFGTCGKNVSRKFHPYTFTHPEGHTYLDPTRQYAYYPLPKVASSLLRGEFVRVSEVNLAEYLDTVHKSDMNPLERENMVNSTVSIRNREDPWSDCSSPDSYVTHWDHIPCGILTYTLVRDPLQRFASGFREMCGYKNSTLREWGSKVLQDVLGGLPDCVSDGSGRADEALERAVMSMACGDWNEHLVPQSTILRPALGSSSDPSDGDSTPGAVGVQRNEAQPQGVRGRHRYESPPTITSHKHLLPFFPVSKRPTCGEPLKYVVPVGDMADFSKVLQKSVGRVLVPIERKTNVRNGWPQPRDLESTLSKGAKDLWCLMHLEDYIRFGRSFCPPTWCEQFRSVGMPEGYFKKRFGKSCKTSSPTDSIFSWYGLEE